MLFGEQKQWTTDLCGQLLVLWEDVALGHPGPPHKLRINLTVVVLDKGK